DVRIFAGCLTGRHVWPTIKSGEIPVQRLAAALAHAELAVDRVTEDEERPRFHCRVLRLATHAPFLGFNRAQAAVIEAAILLSRLDMLPRDKIEREIGYLQMAVGKTAGAAEQEAWLWLIEAIAARYAGLAPSVPSLAPLPNPPPPAGEGRGGGRGGEGEGAQAQRAVR